ncbi:altered inheritance of mitochondria protein 21 isoform X2 [Eutrema salsugineum]|uniref:altered inheritance of mitochondria protein 21 isoform X2 n=1 Tax=Eutrema salsugineum TaxID=72664 RepID=UPI000CECF8C5|nr:altered inheritance of mitochondria protein 21 isoform X2 [Eutrema salsugineum]
MSDSDKELEKQILEAREKLIDPPSSVDELLSLLDKLFLSLSEVEQSPPDSMQNALSPLMKALVAGKLFKHSDVDVKVAVAACISEITRITAPDAPYDDDQMREVFKLIVSSFENLVDNSSRSYSKRTSILETVAKVRSCVVMLDLECDALLIEMFQNFLKAVRDHHSGNVFSSMENIMTLVLEESEDIPPEMLSPILHFVRKDDEVPQVSRRLAEQVLSNCASKLKTYLTEAVKSSGVPFDKYSKIVTSICEGTFSALQQDQLVANEEEVSHVHLTKEAEVEDKQKAAEISTPERTDAPKDESGKSGVSNGVVQQNDSSVDTETKKQDNTNAKDEPQQLDNPSKTDLDNASEEKPDVEHQIMEKEPSSVKQVDSSKTSDIKEETEPGALLDSKGVLKSPPDDSSVNAATSSENEEKTGVQALPSKTSADETANVSSPSRAEDLVEENRPKKTANQKKSSTKEAKPSAANVTEEASEEPNTSEAKVTKKSGKKVASSSKTKSNVPPSKKTTSETKAAKQSEKKVVESDNEQESSKPKGDKKKPGRGKAMDEDTLHTSSGDNEKPAVSSGKPASKSKKEVKQPIEESPNTNAKRKRSLGKEKASDLQNHDESLVGSRVRVWWPMDKAYYTGSVNSYDSAKKKHLVCYDDGDQEILNLKKQKWHFLDESESEVGHYISLISDFFKKFFPFAVIYIFLQHGEEAADQTGHDEEASAEAQQRKKAKTGKQSKIESSGKKGGGAGSSKSKAAPASKSGKKSQDDKTESKPKDSKEPSREEEDSSEELSEEEENPRTVAKSGGAKSGSSKSKKEIVKSGKSKDQGDSGTSKASSKKKEEPSKTMTTSSKSKSGPAKSSSAKVKVAKGKAKSTPSSKAKESDAESESEETPKAPEPATKGKSVGSGKSQGSQTKSGKKRKR